MTTGVISTIEEGLLDQLRALREPMDYIDKALRDDRNEIRTALRELRGELLRIRTRLDSLVPIEHQLRYQSQRIEAVENRFATLVETKLKAPAVPERNPERNHERNEGAGPALDTGRSWGAGEP